MKKLLFVYLTLFIFTSCTTGVSMVENDFSSMLHDGNSKVWMIRDIVSNGTNFAKKGEIKDLLIFYETGSCILQSTFEIGTQTGQKGQFKADFAAKKLVIQFPKEKWEFNVDIKSENEILLTPAKDTKTTFSLVLIPLPELIKNNR